MGIDEVKIGRQILEKAKEQQPELFESETTIGDEEARDAFK